MRVRLQGRNDTVCVISDSLTLSFLLQYRQIKGDLEDEFGGDIVVVSS